MSLTYEKLKTVIIKDPITDIQTQKIFTILKGGSQNTYRAYTTTSISSSSIQFSCPPPSSNIIIDRKIYFLLPIRLTFTGTSPAGNLLNPGTDSLRQYPISSSIDTLTMTINNQTVSIQLSDMIHALSHYNNSESVQNTDFSLSPNYSDQSQQYSDLYGSIRSPLATYGDSIDKSLLQRGGFSYTIVQNTPTSAIVDALVCEPLFLSPLYFGKNNSYGLYNVTTMDFNISFLQNAGNRMWSHDNVSGNATQVTNISYQFNNFTGAPFSYSENQAKMLINYITPLETDIYPRNMPISYSYFDIQRYPTDSGNSFAPLEIRQIQSNNLQLNSIPRRIYIYVRERNNDLYATCHNTDTFFSILNVSVQFENKNGLLSSASQQQLYRISQENGCKLNYMQWAGQPINNANLTSQYYSVGSVLCLEVNKNIGLSSIDSVGKLGNYLLQMNVTCQNISNRNITPTLYVLVVSEGVFTITQENNALINVGVITSNDILNSEVSPKVSYLDVVDEYGGNFFSNLKHFGEKVNDFLKDTKLISKTLKNIPNPYTNITGEIADKFGYGRCSKCFGQCKCGGVRAGIRGGRQIDHAQLMNRINY